MSSSSAATVSSSPRPLASRTVSSGNERPIAAPAASDLHRELAARGDARLEHVADGGGHRPVGARVPSPSRYSTTKNGMPCVSCKDVRRPRPGLRRQQRARPPRPSRDARGRSSARARLCRRRRGAPARDGPRGVSSGRHVTASRSGLPREAPRQVGERVDRRGVRPVEVVDEEHGWPRAGGRQKHQPREAVEEAGLGAGVVERRRRRRPELGHDPRRLGGGGGVDAAAGRPHRARRARSRSRCRTPARPLARSSAP